MSRNMPSSADLGASEIEKLVRPMLLHPLPADAYRRIAQYIQVLYRWNARMNLTAINDSVELIRLHIGECLRCAQLIPPGVTSVLDFGSGGGLPGIPIKIVHPELTVTLAESQAKRAAFLREALRTLDFGAESVFAGRVQELPTGSMFDLIVLRAVDTMGEALQAARVRMNPGGWCMVLTSTAEKETVRATLPDLQWLPPEPTPGTQQRVVLLGLNPDLR